MRFIKRPVVIDAMQWKGDNFEEIEDFLGYSPKSDNDKLYIETLEGEMCASQNDWIIRGVNAEYYPCKSDIFDKTYTSAEEQPNDGANIWKCPRCGSLNTMENISKIEFPSEDDLNVKLMMWCLDCSWVYHADLGFKLSDARFVRVKEREDERWLLNHPITLYIAIDICVIL